MPIERAESHRASTVRAWPYAGPARSVCLLLSVVCYPHRVAAHTLTYIPTCRYAQCGIDPMHSRTLQTSRDVYRALFRFAGSLHGAPHPKGSRTRPDVQGWTGLDVCLLGWQSQSQPASLRPTCIRHAIAGAHLPTCVFPGPSAREARSS